MHVYSYSLHQRESIQQQHKSAAFLTLLGGKVKGGQRPSSYLHFLFLIFYYYSSFLLFLIYFTPSVCRSFDPTKERN